MGWSRLRFGCMDEPEKVGGEGGLLQGGRIAADVVMIRRAARERWEIPAAIRAKLPQVMGAIMQGSESERDRIAAARVLVAADAVNQADDHLADKNARIDAGQATDVVAVVRRP